MHTACFENVLFVLDEEVNFVNDSIVEPYQDNYDIISTFSNFSSWTFSKNKTAEKWTELRRKLWSSKTVVSESRLSVSCLAKFLQGNV